MPTLQRVLASATLGTVVLAAGCHNPFVGGASLPTVTAGVRDVPESMAAGVAGAFTNAAARPIEGAVPLSVLRFVQAIVQTPPPLAPPPVAPPSAMRGMVAGAAPSVGYRLPPSHARGALRRVRP